MKKIIASSLILALLGSFSCIGFASHYTDEDLGQACNECVRVEECVHTFDDALKDLKGTYSVGNYEGVACTARILDQEYHEQCCEFHEDMIGELKYIEDKAKDCISKRNDIFCASRDIDVTIADMSKDFENSDYLALHVDSFINLRDEIVRFSTDCKHDVTFSSSPEKILNRISENINPALYSFNEATNGVYSNLGSLINQIEGDLNEIIINNGIIGESINSLI